MEAKKIVEQIIEKKRERQGSVIQDYFVGVTGNPHKRLFKEHRLNKQRAFYTYVEADSKQDAKTALNELLANDMNGFPLNGHIPGKYVYCYLLKARQLNVIHALNNANYKNVCNIYVSSIY